MLLKDEHQQIRKAFRVVEKAGENAHATEGKADVLVVELAAISRPWRLRAEYGA